MNIKPKKKKEQVSDSIALNKQSANKQSAPQQSYSRSIPKKEAVSKRVSAQRQAATQPSRTNTYSQNRQSSNWKWYSGATPTARETYAQMYRTANGDRAKFEELEGLYAQERATIGSPIYNPYTEATNYKAIQGLADLGVDMSGGVTQEWLNQNIGLLGDKRTTTTGYNAAAPTKKSSAAENAAYWYQTLQNAEERTQAAETENAQLAADVKYWVDRGYSDKAIIEKIRRDFDSNYKTLSKMDEERNAGSALILNRPIDYSGDDTLYGMIWAARNNDQSGDYFTDAVRYTLGQGNKYQYNAASEAARDPSNYEGYHPYSMGSTVEDWNKLTGLNRIDDEKLEANRGMLSGTDAQVKAWQNAFEANENSKQATEQLAALDAWVDQQARRGKTADEIIAMLDSYIDPADGKPDSNYSVLAKMEKARKMGSYIPMGDSLNFTLPQYREHVRDVVNSYGDLDGAEVNEAEAEKNPANYEKYNPYVSSTVDDWSKLTNGAPIDDETLEANRGMLAGPEDEAKAWRNAYKARENGKQASAQLAALDEWVDTRINRGKTADEIIAELDGLIDPSAEDGNPDSDYSMLAKMEKARKTGESILMDGSVDFTLPNYRASIVERVQARDAELAETARQEARANGAASDWTNFWTGSIGDEADKVLDIPAQKDSGDMLREYIRRNYGVDVASFTDEELKAWDDARKATINAKNLGESREAAEAKSYELMEMASALAESDRAKAYSAEARPANADVAAIAEIVPKAVAPAYDPKKSIAYTSVYGDGSEPREGMADMNATPQRYEIGAGGGGEEPEVERGSEDATPRSPESEAYMAMCSGGQWDATAYRWAMNRSTNPDGLRAELINGIEQIRRGNISPDEAGLAGSWYNEFEHLFSGYDTQWVATNSIMGASRRAYDPRDDYGEALGGALKSAASAFNNGDNGALTEDEYTGIMLDLSRMTEIVDGVSEDVGQRGSATSDMLVQELNLTGAIADVQARIDSAVQQKNTEDAQLAEAGYSSTRNALTAMFDGEIDQEQQATLAQAQYTEISEAAKDDAVYNEMQDAINLSLDYNTLADRGYIPNARYGLEADTEITAKADAYASGVKALARAKLDQDMKYATAAGMTLEEYYQAYSKAAKTGESLIADAEREYNEAWGIDFKGSVQAILEANMRIAQGEAPQAETAAQEQSAKEDGEIGVYGDIALGIDQGMRGIDKGLLAIVNNLSEPEVNSPATREILIKQYDGDAKKRRSDLLEMVEAMPDVPYKEELRVRIETTPDIWSIGDNKLSTWSRGQIQAADADMQAIGELVERYGTSADKYVMQAASGVASSTTLMAGSALASAGFVPFLGEGLGNLAGSIVAAIPEGSEMTYDLRDQGVDTDAAFYAGLAYTIFSGATEDLMDIGYNASAKGRYAMREMFNEGFWHTWRTNPKIAARASAAILASFAGNALGEGAQEAVQSLGGSMLENIATGKPLLSESDFEAALGEGIAALPSSAILGLAGGGYIEANPYIDEHGNMLTYAEAKAMPDFDGTVANNVIEHQTTQQAVQDASADLNALIQSSEYQAVQQTQVEADTAMQQAQQAEAEAQNTRQRERALSDQLQTATDEMLAADVVTEEMTDNIAALSEALPEATNARIEAERKAAELTAVAAEVSQRAEATANAIQAQYTQIMETAKSNARQFVLDRFFHGATAEQRAVYENYLEKTAELTEAKSQLYNAKIAAEKYGAIADSKYGSAAQTAYGRALNIVDRLSDEVAALNEQADALYDAKYEAIPDAETDAEFAKAEARSYAEKAAQEAQADPMNVRKQMAADLAAKRLQSETAAAELAGKTADIAARLESRDSATRQAALTEYKTLLDQANTTAQATEAAQQQYAATDRTQTELNEAIADFKQYTNTDLTVDGAPKHDAAVAAYERLQNALRDADIADAQNELARVTELLTADNADTQQAFTEAGSRLNELLQAKDSYTGETSAARQAAVATALQNGGLEQLQRAINSHERADVIQTLSGIAVQSQENARALRTLAGIQDTTAQLTVKGDTGATGQPGLTRAYAESSVKLNDDQKTQMQILDAFAKDANIEIVVHPTVSTVEGAVNGAYIEGNVIHIGLDAIDQGYVQAGFHGTVHWIAQNAQTNPDAYSGLEQTVFDALRENGADIDSLVRQRIEQYAQNGVNISEQAAREEIVAESCGMVLTDKQNMLKFAQEHKSAFQAVMDGFVRFWEKLKSIAVSIGNKNQRAEMQALLGKDSALQKIYDNFMAAAKETGSTIIDPQIQEEAAQSYEFDASETMQNVQDDAANEAQYSLNLDSQLADAAIKKNAKLKDGQKNVSDETLQAARQIRTELQQFMLENADNLHLPEDKLGQTVFSNSSYGKTVENSLICPRTMALDYLMDEISDTLGRPLTVAEQTYISQDVIGMAQLKEPQCAYCYVAADRAAYREYLGDYINQRDAVLEKYRSGSMTRDALYADFLNGRKDTPNMRNRFDMWLANEDSGAQVLSSADLANIDKLTDLEASQYAGIKTGEAPLASVISDADNFKAQLVDAMQYTQAASWAKKRVKYAAYDGSILKIPRRTVDKLNSMYGLRFYSFSDASPAYALENMQMINDAAVMGFKGLGYTKVAWWADMVAESGMNVNVSVFGHEINGQIVEDNLMGASWQDVQALRERHPNVGAVFVATNDNLVDWALAQDWIDVVIPYHLVRTGKVVADILNYTNYTDVSGDKKTDAWDKHSNVASISAAMHNNDMQTYLQLCEENNLTPRFEKWINNPNYMKLVNETRQSVTESKAMQPITSQGALDVAKRELNTMAENGGFYVPIGGSQERASELAGELAQKVQNGDYERASYSMNPSVLSDMQQRDTESAINYLAGQLVDNGPRAAEIAKALANMNQSASTGRETQGIRRDMGIFRKDRSSATQQNQRGDVQNPIQIMRDLTDSIQVGYNPGGQMSANGARVNSNVMGFYNERARAITTRTSEAGDLAIGLHEFGHAAQARLENLHANDAMLNALPTTVKQNYAQAELDGEAVAEFVVDYMYGRDRAVATAGEEYVRDFERQMRSDPELLKAVTRGRDQVTLWNTADTGTKIRAMMSETSAHKQRKGGISNLLSEINRQVFDYMAPAKQVSDELYEAAQWSASASKRAEVVLTQNLIDPEGNIVGESLSQRLADAGATQEMYRDVAEYALARHAIDRDRAGKPVFDVHEITAQDLRNYVTDVEAKHPEVVRAADAMVGFWQDFFDAWMVQTGMVDQSTVDTMRQMYPNYVPTFRVMDENFGKKNGAGSSFTLRAAKQGGSSLEVINPIYGITRMTQQVVNTVSQNQVARIFHEAMQQGDFGWLATREAADMRAVNVDTSKAGYALADLYENLTASGADVDPTAFEDFYDTLASMRQSWTNPGWNKGANVISGVDADGKRFFYKIKDKGMYELLSGSANTMVLGSKLIVNAKNTFTRLTTSSNPFFALKNAARDFQVSVNTGTWAVTYVDGAVKWARAFHEALHNSKEFAEWRNMGGGEHTRLSSETGAKTRQLVDTLFKSQRRVTPSKIKDALIQTVTLEKFNNLIENTSRFAEYRFGRHDTSTFEGRREAFMASQDVTTNFATHGASALLRGINRIVPFCNATMQGLSKDINIIKNAFNKDGSVRARSWEAIGKTALNVGLTAALQAALIGAFSGGDDDRTKEEYGILSEEMSAGNLIIPIPKWLIGISGFDRPYIRIPIAQGPLTRSIYAAGLQIMSDVANMDEMSVDMHRTAQAILRDSLPDGSIFQALIDAKYNKTWDGRNIVSDYVLKRSVPNQYNNDTLEVFKTVSKWLYGAGIEISPAVMQYVTEQYTGFVGKLIIPMLSGNRYTGERSFEQSLKNLGYSILKNYTIDPLTSTDLTNDYSAAKTIATAIQYDAQNGDPVLALSDLLTDAEREEAIEIATKLQKKGGVFYDADREIKEYWGEISNIRQSDLTDAEKGQQIREIRYDIDKVMEAALADWEEYKMYYIDHDTLAIAATEAIRKGRP